MHSINGNTSEQRTAYWTLILSVSTVFLTFFTGGVFFYAIKQGKDTKKIIAATSRQVQAVEEQLKISRADSRAVIGLPKIDLGIDEENNYSFRFIIPNKGKNTAHNIAVAAHIREAYLADIVAEANKECESIRLHRNSYMLSQGDTFIISNVKNYIETSISVKEIAASHKNIVGCITYRSGEETELYETAFYAILGIANAKPFVDSVYGIKNR